MATDILEYNLDNRQLYYVYHLIKTHKAQLNAKQKTQYDATEDVEK